MKILVVDDEKTIVKGIKFTLENEGYQVDVCYDGETAVDMARHGEYAVILLDLMMPKLDGLGACQQIRQISTVPIIMLTARSEDADKLMGFACGADDYVTKPFNILAQKPPPKALLRRACGPRGLENLWCCSYAGNHNSLRVQQKCGFRPHHELRDHLSEVTGERRTELVRRITRDEWLQFPDRDR